MKGFRLRIGDRRLEYSCENGHLHFIMGFMSGTLDLMIRSRLDGHSETLFDGIIASDILMELSFGEITDPEVSPLRIVMKESNCGQKKYGMVISSEGKEYRVALDKGCCSFTVYYNDITKISEYAIAGYMSDYYYHWAKGTVEDTFCFRIMKTEIMDVTPPYEMIKCERRNNPSR